MKLFVDDRRDPYNYYPDEEFVWIKTPAKAIVYMDNYKKDIVEIHLDFQLDDYWLNGGDVFQHIAYDIPWDDTEDSFKNEWPLLTTIVLHSSEPQLFDEYIGEWMINNLQSENVTVIKKPLKQ